MAVNSSYLGSARVSGTEAEAFARKITHARGTKAASASALNGRNMASTFAQKGVVVIKLPPRPKTK